MSHVASKRKVVIGMSGGVDSSVAALLLKEQGFTVFGVSMELYSCDRPTAKGCCTPADRLDARKVCESLGISFDIIDLRQQFREKVIDYFVEEYVQGRTPLPCAPCNREVRFQALLDYADRKGAYWIATGHYARVDHEKNQLLTARNLQRDQSYFLYGLTPDVLDRLRLPLGDWSKDQVRAKAKEAGLVTHEKPDSQEICFVGDADYPKYMEAHYPEQTPSPGFFVNQEGKILGKHRGVHAYTIGQRRGLGLSSASGRQYVTSLNAEKNEVTVGPKELLKAGGLKARVLQWHEEPKMGETVLVKIRSGHKGVLANVVSCNGFVEVSFQEPQYAVTPGQAAVFYKDGCVLGGGTIVEAIP